MADVTVAPGPTRATTLPTDPTERKKYPIATGVLDYFPDAIVEIARISFEGNEQHNPGEPLHWARGKSMDQEDTTLRHFMQRGTRDTDGRRHLGKAAWRILAMLQLEIEEEEKAKAPSVSSPFDSARVGDMLPLVTKSGPCCGVVSPDHCGCTREPRHSGQHVAQYRSGTVCDVWGNNPWRP